MSSKKVFCNNNKTSAPGKQVECSYCHEKGHMIRECKVLAAKEAKQKMFLKRPHTIEKKEPAIKVNVKIPVVSKFAALDSDSEDECPETELEPIVSIDNSYINKLMEEMRGFSWAEINEMYLDV